MKCAIHPDVETNLRCGKCSKPICPKCMVQTPVGARCPDCARLYKLPTYHVSTAYYLRAIAAGLGLAIVCGLLWGLIADLVPFFYLNFLLAAAAGYVMGDLISRAVNRKRGRGLALIAGIALVISYMVRLAFHGWFPLIPFDILSLAFDLMALAIGIFITTRNFSSR